MAPNRVDAPALDRVVESSLFKLLMPVLGTVLVFMLQQVLGRLDRMEAAYSAMQTAQALNARDVDTLKQAKVARDVELSDVHRQISELSARMAVVEAKGERH